MTGAKPLTENFLPLTYNAEYGEGRSFHRAIVKLPEWHGLAEHTRLRLVRLDKRIEILRSVATTHLPCELLAAFRARFREKLEHRLSWCFFEKPPHKDWTKRTAIEQSALTKMHTSLWYFAVAGMHEEFRCALGDLCTLGLGVVSCYRTIQQVSTTEARGGRVIFPNATLASIRLGEVVDMLNQQPKPYPSWIFFATVIMVCISNAHPFTNGNGRVSRMLFNSVLRWGGGMPGDAYIPLYEINEMARGGFELRVREAELGHGWDKLAHYICDVIEIVETYY